MELAVVWHRGPRVACDVPRVCTLREGDVHEWGMRLDPLPPGPAKDPDSRWIDIHEGELDEAQMETWVRQAAELPGWFGFDTL